MNEWLQKNFGLLKAKWAKWSLVQKLVGVAIVVAIVATIIVTMHLNAKTTDISVFTSPIKDEKILSEASRLLDEEGIKHETTADGKLTVENSKLALQARSVLIANNVVGGNTDPFSLFDVNKWSRTDFDDTVNWKRAIEALVKKHIEALHDIREAHVVVNIPDEKLLADDETPPTASVIIKPASGSDIATNKKKVKALQNLILKAVDGLTDENLTIALEDGTEINDFAGMEASDQVDVLEKQQKLISKKEKEYADRILKELAGTFTKDRVRNVSVKFDMDMSKKSIDAKKITPIMLKERTPGLPYDDSERVESITISSETVTNEWQGTGYNPEGPAGVEGQNPPVYSDMTNVIGKSKQVGEKKNQVVNEENIKEEKNPELGRRSVSVNIDGIWKTKYDKNHNPVITEEGSITREYIPLTDKELKDAEERVKSAIGFDAVRGDTVTVTNSQVDRSLEFAKEDAQYFATRQRQKMIFYSLAGIALVMVIFLVFRFVSRELERRRRQREEEMLRQQQMAREAALREANEDGMEVSMTVEERRRVELQENAVAMAKEHPEDVAMLIRTWLSEE